MPTIDLGSVVGPQGPQGNTGPQGPQGNPGPNEILTTTETALEGILAGNGSTVETLNTGTFTLAQLAQALKDAALHPNMGGFAPYGYGLGLLNGADLPLTYITYDESHGDFNRAIQSGFWQSTADALNAPVNTICDVLVIAAGGIIHQFACQRASIDNGVRIFSRLRLDGTWSPWELIYPATIYLTFGNVSSLPITRYESHITTKHRVIMAEFGTPNMLASDITYQTGPGSITLFGTLLNTTSISLTLAAELSFTPSTTL